MENPEMTPWQMTQSYTPGLGHLLGRFFYLTRALLAMLFFLLWIFQKKDNML
jgi:hypothetical protein